jgi:leucyl/phenylalanyl-tRNA--protein transferase
MPVPVRCFPDPRHANPEGVVAIGGDLHPDTLAMAYRQGIFPWPVEGLPLLWFCPAERAVLDFCDLHLPRSLARAERHTALRFTVDASFGEVIRSCAAAPRPGQEGTWITPDMLRAYIRFHRLGFAHSVEAWEHERLVGGIYGVDVDGAFAAESMFYRVPNASKLALLYLIRHLQARGLDWLDVQVMTPHLERFGAHSISRDTFLERLGQTRSRGLRLFDPIRRNGASG